HAADVADERDLRDRDRRIAHHHGLGARHDQPGPRRRRGRRVDDEHRERLPDHRPHAEDVPRQEGPAVTTAQHITQASYLLAAALFIFSLRWLNSPKTARQGVAAGVAGMVFAIGGTLLHPDIVSYKWIAIALVVGTVVGIPLSWVPLTAVPQRTALSHAFGGLAAGLVVTAKYVLWREDGVLRHFRIVAIVVEVILGFLTFTGSLMAAGKLQEVLPTRPLTYRNQNVVNFTLLGIAVLSGIYLIVNPETWQLFPVVVVLSLVFGVLLILPI